MARPKKRVIKYSREGKQIGDPFESLSEVALSVSVNGSNINHCCKGVNATCKGFIFLYEEEVLANENLILERVEKAKRTKQETRPVVAREYDHITKKASSKIALRFNSIKEAVEEGFDKSCIIKCCKGGNAYHAGYKWSYK